MLSSAVKVNPVRRVEGPGDKRQMQTQPYKLGREPLKRVEEAKATSNSPGSSLLSVEAEPQSLLFDDPPHLYVRGEHEAVDVAFQTLLYKANRELAKLLRDVRTGAQDGLHASSDDRRISELLQRAVRCAAKQYVLQMELGNLALKDELTGFYNRRGFQALAERQLKLGRRSGRGMLLFFIDVDGLKQINDSFGHDEGDHTLRRTAEILKKTFRDSDIVGRLGGDEFAALAIEADDHSEATIMARLGKCLKIANAGHSKWTISLSVGVARFDHGNPTSIRKLLVRADQAMYEQKRTRSSSRIPMDAGYPC